jgi:hypothetical protein
MYAYRNTSGAIAQVCLIISKSQKPYRKMVSVPNISLWIFFRVEEYLTSCVREGSRNVRRSSTWNVRCCYPILTTISTWWEIFGRELTSITFRPSGCSWVTSRQTDGQRRTQARGMRPFYAHFLWERSKHGGCRNSNPYSIFSIRINNAQGDGHWKLNSFRPHGANRRLRSQTHVLQTEIQCDYGNEYKYSHKFCIHSSSAVDSPHTPASPGRHDNGWECLSLPPSCESSKSRLKESAGTRWFTNVTTNGTFLFRRIRVHELDSLFCFHGDIPYLCFV